MKILIAVGLVTLAAISAARAAECQPPAGATCSRSGDSLVCRHTRCNDQRCYIINTVVTQIEGKCVFRHSTIAIPKIKPP